MIKGSHACRQLGQQKAAWRHTPRNKPKVVPHNLKRLNRMV